MSGCDVSIILAAYNEEACIADELNIIKQAMDNSSFTYEVIVVDDASTDRTAQIVKGFSWVKLIQNHRNRGAGGARKTGTLAAKGNIIVWSDVDMSYPNQEIPNLVKMLTEKGYDQVIGARKSEKGTLKLLRAPAKYIIRKLACFLSKTYIPDLNSGLRAFKREIVSKYLYLLPEGFSCVSTVTLAFLCNGYDVGYMPIDYRKRIGKSKFHPVRDTYAYFIQVIRMITYFSPLRVFLPISLFLFSVGIVSAVINIFSSGGLQQMDVIIILFAVMIGAIGLLADSIVIQHKKETRDEPV
ncbi:MAG: glycosyltransferase family 2 protein [Candidatus Omnitrophota bacterium]